MRVPKIIPDLNGGTAGLVVGLDVDVDGEMGVDVAHLVLESTGDTDHEVVDDGADGAESSNTLASTVVELDGDDILLGAAEGDGDVGQVLDELAAGTLDGHDAGLNVDLHCGGKRWLVLELKGEVLQLNAKFKAESAVHEFASRISGASRRSHTMNFFLLTLVVDCWGGCVCGAENRVVALRDFIVRSSGSNIVCDRLLLQNSNEQWKIIEKRGRSPLSRMGNRSSE